jgi:hypothetical protein
LPLNGNSREFITAWFCKQRRLAPEDVPNAIQGIICATSSPYLLMIELLDSLEENDPASGLLVKLIDRAYSTLAGALTLLAVGQLREAEILSRSIFEGATTTAFIARKNTPARLSQYFRSYVAQEKQQNNKWENELLSADAETKREHLIRIREKETALGGYELIIDEFEKFYGLKNEGQRFLPKLIDMLSESNQRIEYRTVYAAMCSQAHLDAEDILNYFFAKIVNGMPEIPKKMEREADTFSIFMVLLSCRKFIESSIEVFSKLKFASAKTEANLSLTLINRHLQHVVHCLDSGELPKGWTSE